MLKLTASRMVSTRSGSATRLLSRETSSTAAVSAFGSSMDGSMVMTGRWGRFAARTRGPAWRRAGEAFVAVLLWCCACVNVAAAEAGGRVLLVMGDSLSAGYNLAADQGWV